MSLSNPKEIPDFFKEYRSKPIVRAAIEITAQMTIDKLSDSTSVLLVPGGGNAVEFGHFEDEPVEVGDFVIWEASNDVYHCNRDAFIKRYVIPKPSDENKPDYLIRMEQERDELYERTEKLWFFIRRSDKYPALDESEQIDLVQQHGFMSAYLKVLQKRIRNAAIALRESD